VSRGGRASTLSVHDAMNESGDLFRLILRWISDGCPSFCGPQLSIVFFPGCCQGPNESEGLGKYCNTGENPTGATVTDADVDVDVDVERWICRPRVVDNAWRIPRWHSKAKMDLDRAYSFAALG
jgi:hypothetical protein